MARHYAGVVRARRDRDEGRLWKARDRLHGVLQAAPADQEALELLGMVYREMGDLPNAGRYWWLTERSGPEVDHAVDAMHERYPFPELLRHVPARAPLDQYPVTVQGRIEQLEAKAAEHGLNWTRVRSGDGPPRKTAGTNVGDRLMIGVFLVFGPGLWLLGVASAISLIVR